MGDLERYQTKSNTQRGLVLDCICLTTTHALQDILAALHEGEERYYKNARIVVIMPEDGARPSADTMLTI